MSRGWRRCDGSRWGERVIRDGRIRWYGRTYAVAEEKAAPLSPKFEPKPYDGSLDGRRAMFSEYGHTEHFPTLRDVVFLHSFGDEWPGPNCDEHGFWHWDRWEAEA